MTKEQWLKTIDIVTNIIGLLAFIAEPIRAYVESQPFNWWTFAQCIFFAALAYFTGKGALAKAKTLDTR